jgi:hypothetical protein
VTLPLGKIYPQGGAPAFTSVQRMDTRRGDELIPRTSLNGGQKSANIGDTVPLIFCKRSGSVGGVWISPPATEARFDNNAVAGYKNGIYVTYHLVLCGGQIGSVAAADVYHGETRITDVLPDTDETLAKYSLTQNYNARAGSFTAASAITQLYKPQRIVETTTEISGPIGEAATAKFDTGTDFPRVWIINFLKLQGDISPTIATHSDAWSQSIIPHPGSHTATEIFFTGKTIESKYRATSTVTLEEPYTKPTGIPQFCGTGGTYTDLATLAVSRGYPDGDGRWNRQCHVFVRNGQYVTDVRTNASGSSSNLADIAYHLLRLNNFVAVDLIDIDLLKRAASFTETQALFFNGILSSATNLRDFLARTAPQFLLTVTQRGGKWGLSPLLPYTSSYQLYTGALTPTHVFTEDDIILTSYKRDFIPLDQRKPFCATMLWRSQPANDVGEIKSTDVRYSGTALNGPFEQYDLSSFCVTEAHATKIGRYILAKRKHTTHTLRFNALPSPSASAVNPGDFVKVSLTRRSPPEADTVSNVFYQVNEITENINGTLSFKLTHFPTNGSDQSLINIDIGGGSSSGGQNGPVTIGDVTITASVLGRPGIPTGLVATPSYYELVLGWNAPAFNGGSPITNYVVQYKPTADATWITSYDFIGPALSTVLSDLLPGTSYDIRVAAITNRGQGAWSTPATVSTTSASPVAPIDLTTLALNASVQLAWNPPPGELTELFPITEYVVQYKVTADPDWTTAPSPGTELAASITGLTNGTGYSFRVAAISALGQSPWSTVATATPLVPVPPSAPTDAEATVYLTTAALTWTAPASAGTSPILRYIIEVGTFGGGVGSLYYTELYPYPDSIYLYDDDEGNFLYETNIFDVGSSGGDLLPLFLFSSALFLFPEDGDSVLTSAAVPSSTYTVDSDSLITAAVLGDLPADATFAFRVAAISAAGQGPWSDYAAITVSSVPLATPTAPLAPLATAGNTQIAFSWTAPTSAGTSAITDYIVQYRRYDSITWLTFADGVGTGLSTTLTGLTNEVQYFLRVAASSAQGQGPWSSTISTTPVTPLLPSFPTALTSTPSTFNVVLNWAAPSPGTSPITDYVVQFKLASDSTWTTFTDGTSTATSANLTGLVSLSSYNFRVAAVTAVGQGPWSGTHTATTMGIGLPGAPGNLTGYANNSSTVTLMWTAPSPGTYAITDYVIQRTTNPAGSWTTINDGVSVSLGQSFFGLNASTTYYFRVAAISSAGTGPWSSTITIATPGQPPSAPSGVTAGVFSASGAAFWVSWPVSNPYAPSCSVRYKLTSASTWSTRTLSVPARSPSTLRDTLTVTGVPAGSSYHVQVALINENGQGPYSSTVTATL